MSPGTIMSPKGIHRMLGDMTSSLLKEPIASTSQQRTGSIWLSAQEKKGTGGPKPGPSEHQAQRGDGMWSQNAGTKQLCALPVRCSDSLFGLKTDSGKGKGN